MGLVKIPHLKNGGKNEHPFKAQQSSVPGLEGLPEKRRAQDLYFRFTARLRYVLRHHPRPAPHWA